MKKCEACGLTFKGKPKFCQDCLDDFDEFREHAKTHAHRKAIYALVQNTLDFCGNSLEAVKDYCSENNLDWRDFEAVRFLATKDYMKRGDLDDNS